MDLLITLAVSGAQVPMVMDDPGPGRMVQEMILDLVKIEGWWVDRNGNAVRAEHIAAITPR